MLENKRHRLIYSNQNGKRQLVIAPDDEGSAHSLKSLGEQMKMMNERLERIEKKESSQASVKITGEYISEQIANETAEKVFYRAIALSKHHNFWLTKSEYCDEWDINEKWLERNHNHPDFQQAIFRKSRYKREYCRFFDPKTKSFIKLHKFPIDL